VGFYSKFHGNLTAVIYVHRISEHGKVEVISPLPPSKVPPPHRPFFLLPTPLLLLPLWYYCDDARELAMVGNNVGAGNIILHLAKVGYREGSKYINIIN